MLVQVHLRRGIWDIFFWSRLTLGRISTSIPKTAKVFSGGQLRLQSGQSVQLATGKDLNKLDGELSLTLVEHEYEEEEKNRPIGWISYSEGYKDWMKIYHKAFYSMQIRIPRRQFGPLLTALNQGRLPSLILLDVEGLTSVSPDGSYKQWDNKNSPNLQITSIEFITSLISAAQLIGGHPHDFWINALTR